MAHSELLAAFSAGVRQCYSIRFLLKNNLVEFDGASGSNLVPLKYELVVKVLPFSS